MNLGVKFDQEAFPLEAQLADLGPVEGVYPRVSLQRTHRYYTVLLPEEEHLILSNINYEKNIKVLQNE